MARVVVITGGSSGIGAALSKELARRGDHLVLAARNRSALDTVAHACGSNALAVPTDVTQRDQVGHLRDAALARFGHVDVWINNAGQGINKPALALTDEDLDAMLDVNLRSVIYGAQAIVPHFKERGSGHLVNVSSFLGRVPLATYRSAYNIAKAGVNAFTANLRMDLASEAPGVKVSLVMPGIVATAFPTSVRGDGGEPWAVGQRVGPQTVQGPEEVASQIAGLLDAPRAEIYTHPQSHDLAIRYFSDVRAFEAQRR